MTFGRHQYWDETPYQTHYEDFTLNVEPDERVGPPLPSRYTSVFRKLLFVGVLLGGGWVVATDDAGPDSWISQARTLLDVAVTNAKRLGLPSAQEEAALPPSDLAPVPDELGAPGSFGVMPGDTTLTPPIMQAHVEGTPWSSGEAAPSEAPAAEEVGTAYSETAEPAEEEKDRTPERKRAVAAGLGPDLPNVLLSRLTKTDLENAAYAIKTAIAKTPDDGTFSWPRSPSRQQAAFEVRFVEGAAEGCRRYVVKVTKDRWSSTSAALEKCGEAGPRAG